MKKVITAMLMSIKSEGGGSHEEPAVIDQKKEVSDEIIYQREVSEGAKAAEVHGALIETKSSKSFGTDQPPSSTSNTSVKESAMGKFLDDISNMSNEKIQELVIEVLKEGKYKQEIVPIDIWDFGGQKDYYMTHQLFITSRGIFVLMFNGSHDIHHHMSDLAFLPGHHGKPTTAGNYIFQLMYKNFISLPRPKVNVSSKSSIEYPCELMLFVSIH